MSEIAITIGAGKSKRLLTEGKCCDKNIVVTAEGGATLPNAEGVFEFTESKYAIKGSTLTDIQNKLQELTYWSRFAPEDLTPELMPTAIKSAYDAAYGEGYGESFSYGVQNGKQVAYDEFWDAFQDNGTKTNYVNAFSGSGWKDTNYNPKYPITATNHAGGIFTYCSNITSTKVPIIIDNIAANTMVFFSCSALKTIPSLKVTDQVKSYSDWFYNCKALEEINFTEDSVIKANISFAYSPLLTTASVDSIINALKDLTGATAQTLTLHATVKGNLTQAQKDAIAAKNWTLA